MDETIEGYMALCICILCNVPPDVAFRCYESGELELTCQLPEAGERILVVDNQGYISIDEQCCDDDGWYLDDHADWLDVVAWMPLPEVYQVEGGER